MSDVPTPADRRDDATVSTYIAQFQHRYPQFQREQRTEVRRHGPDPITSFFHEHLLFRNKTSYDAFLRELLTPPERDRLQTDRTFTQAWHIFVDLCWLRKRLQLAVILVAGVLLLLGGLIFLVWAVPHFININKQH